MATSATSDVLQFHYRIENEVAQNAAKNFAGMLGKAFEQYKKLWIEYLKLRKYCEDADVKIPFQLFESESDNKDLEILSQCSESHTEPLDKYTSQVLSENAKLSVSTYESISNECGSGIVSNPKQIEKNKLLHSPVLIKKRNKFRRSSVMSGRYILDDSEENIKYIPAKENIQILANSSQEDIYDTSVETKKSECSVIENNNDEIECTPLSTMPRKLGVSKLYNVDTTLLRNGRKLKQSTLMFFPNERSTENIGHEIHKELALLKPHMSLTPQRKIQQNSKYLSSMRAAEEEIVEDSPTKPSKLHEKSSRGDNDVFGKLTDSKTRDIKLDSLSNPVSLNQYLPVYTSMQKDEPYLIKRLKTFSNSDNESVDSESNMLTSPTSPTLVSAEHLIVETPERETKKLEVRGNENQAQKRKFSETINETCGYNTSAGDDETFCLLGERFKEKFVSNVDNTKDFKERIPKSTSSELSPVKKSLLDSFDMVPEKKQVFSGKSKSKAERAKMQGVSCWECKKYYAELGLSEREIKQRQNQCSRHRTKYNERESTPEGFWDPLFPDTFASSFQDD
ncbi:PREDICTED: DNA endonuclease RBBP8-like [Dufourea novaeangliae]|uniref:DNA endonuclease RBBP8-like n=1 Tax=Dufourea novaeangliae TaxID=178035 RepID=UPI000767B719|nr:PREDICTED: DNA endonuclease RBBP8-like [Dufourea novaeangliae]